MIFAGSSIAVQPNNCPPHSHCFSKYKIGCGSYCFSPPVLPNTFVVYMYVYCLIQFFIIKINGGILSYANITTMKIINEDDHIDFLQAPLYFVDILAYCNLLFTTLFTIECCLKVFALGPKVSIIQTSVKYPKRVNKRDA